jgi:hypothetical protein
MALSIVIAAAVMLIAGAGLGALAMVVTGIRRIDRPGHRLTDEALSPVDAATRRVLGVGVRTPDHDHREQEWPCETS